MRIEIISGKKWRYRLPEDETFIFKYELDEPVDTPYIKVTGKIIRGKKGYCWDGSSVPLKRITKFFSFGLWDADKYCKIASLHHDIYYQLMKSGLLSKEYKDNVDKLYRSECIKGGMPEWEANTRYWFLKKFGSLKYQDMSPKIIEV